MSATMHLHHGIVVNHRCAEPCPCRHKLSAFCQKITAPVSRLAFVRDAVRERHFAYLVREGRALRSPIPERTAEAMDGRTHPDPAERHVEGHDRKWFAGLFSRKYELATASRRHIRQDCQGAFRQRHPMLPSGLHAFRRHGPQPTFKVDLRPAGADYLACASGGQDQEFKPTRRNSGRRCEPFHKVRKVVDCYCGMVAARQALPFRKELIQMSAPARRVLAGAQFLRAGPIQDCLYAPAHP